MLWRRIAFVGVASVCVLGFVNPSFALNVPVNPNWNAIIYGKVKERVQINSMNFFVLLMRQYL